jgi:hypothetical protein
MPLLRGPLLPEKVLGELVENCGAGRTSANPVLATWWLRWLRFPSEPRGIPMPAEPDFNTKCDGGKAEIVPPFPTGTVFTVPVTGGARGWKPWGNVPA